MKKFLETKSDEKAVETKSKETTTNSELTKPSHKPSANSTVAQRIKNFVLENNSKY